VDRKRLATALAGLVGGTLAQELSADFAKIRDDLATRTLERASPGKFVETFVQCLQQIETGSYSSKPDVDRYLREVENRTALPDGLRFCAARVARSMYTLRNKRNIAHKNEVDPNTIDLRYCYMAAEWIMSELIRHATGLSMEQAGAVIDLLQAPVGALVEEIDGTRIVHGAGSVRAELLILLHSHYPDRIEQNDMMKSLETRSPSAVRSRIAELRHGKLLHGDSKQGYRLTQAGHAAAVVEIRRLTDGN
jgi:hypothetical protein